MKILILTQYFYPEPFKINDVALELNKRGHFVSVLTSAPNYPEGKIYPGYKNRFSKCNLLEIIIYRVPIVSRGGGNKIRLAMNYFSFVLTASFRILFIRDYDVVFVYEPSPISVALPAIFGKYFTRKRILFWVQDIWPESMKVNSNIKNDGFYKILNVLIKFIYKKCDKIIVSCKGFIEKITRYNISVFKISVVANPGEEIFLNEDSIEELYSGYFKIIFGGNIGNSQDFETILNAGELLLNEEKIIFLIFGDGRRFNWLKEQIIQRNLQSKIILFGRKKIEEMPKIFNNADVLLLNLKNEDIFNITVPSKLQSYLAVGKPIIAGLKGEGKTIIEEANAGITCEPENELELASAITRIFNMSKEDRKKMGANGRKYFITNYKLDVITSQIENNLKELIE